MVDAKRFETIAHATVMSSGRLRFATDAMEMMGLDKVKGIILFKTSCQGYDGDEEIEFGAVTCTEEDARAFSLKSSGPYKYLSLKNFFLQNEIDFKNYNVSYEITEVNEQWDGKPVFRMTQRQTPKPNKQPEEEQTDVPSTEVDDMPF